MKGLALFAAVALAISASAANALVVTFTEGDGQNRKLVAGSQDLEDSPSGIGFILGDFALGDVVQLHGRIVSSEDLFTFSFSSATDFTIDFDFDGYELAAGGFEANSGLVGQAVLGGDPTPGLDSKGVRFTLDGNGSVLTQDFMTDVLAGSGIPSTIFVGEGGADYVLTVDGSIGPNTGIAALYDLRISAVPVPAALPLFLTALAGFGFVSRFRKRQTA